MTVIFKRTKIIATLGPASGTLDMVKQLAFSGVNGFRLNCSHGDDEQRTDFIDWVRQASAEMNKPVAVLLDLQGPKVRLGNLTEDTAVSKGDEVILGHNIEHNGLTVPVQYNLAEKVKNGERLFFCDGTIRSVVIDIVSDNSIKVRLENSGTLSRNKGINLPDTSFGGDIITDKDLHDIEFGVNHDIDYVALSFVQNAGDIVKLREILKSHNSDAKIIAKIETKSATAGDELEEIIKVSDGAMVARGDLASEVGAERVPIIQRKIVALCRKHGKISIVATQMMLSMCEEPEPTRAEVSDVATAVSQGVDVVMLSDETTIGKYPTETVAAMKKVILYTQDNDDVNLVKYEVENKDIVRGTIASAAVSIAQELGASAIIVDTKSGATAANISSHRPKLVVVSVTSIPRIAQQLCLRYASRNYVRPDGENVCSDLAKEIKEQGLCGEGEATFVTVSGRQPCVTGTTDTIKIIAI